MIDYTEYLLKADKHMRMAYHHSELKDYKRAIMELTGALVEIKLALTITKALDDKAKKSQG